MCRIFPMLFLKTAHFIQYWLLTLHAFRMLELLLFAFNIIIVIMKSLQLWRSIQHNNTTPLVRMRFSGTSLLGKQGQICFAEYLKKIVQWFSLKLFVRTGWISDFVLKQTKGGFPSKFGIFGPFEISGIGDKTPTTPTTPSVNNCRASSVCSVASSNACSAWGMSFDWYMFDIVVVRRSCVLLISWLRHLVLRLHTCSAFRWCSC